MKKCGKCEITKDLSEFSKRNDGYYRYECIQCSVDRIRKHQVKKQPKKVEVFERSEFYKKKYPTRA